METRAWTSFSASLWDKLCLIFLVLRGWKYADLEICWMWGLLIVSHPELASSCCIYREAVMLKQTNNTEVLAKRKNNIPLVVSCSKSSDFGSWNLHCFNVLEGKISKCFLIIPCWFMSECWRNCKEKTLLKNLHWWSSRQTVIDSLTLTQIVYPTHSLEVIPLSCTDLLRLQCEWWFIFIIIWPHTKYLQLWDLASRCSLNVTLTN